MKQLTLNFQNDLEPAGEMTTSSLPAGSRSHASHFQQRENEKVQPITVTSGRKCLESFGRFAPDGSWEKTFSELLIGREDWFSNVCTLTWKMRGTRSRRLFFQLVASAPNICDTECGLLPTPTATDKGTGRMNRSLSPGAASRPSIALAARMGLLPTPTANDGKNATLPESQKDRTSLVGEVMKKTDGRISQLNPLFVQEMMGFPHLWTELPFQSGDQNLSKPTETR